MTTAADGDGTQHTPTEEPLGLSVFWGYLAGFCLVIIPVFFLVENPIAVLANLRIVDELADMGIVRDVDVGTGFIDGVPEVLAHSRRPLSWNLLVLAFAAVAGAYLVRGVRQRLLLRRSGIPESVPGQLSTFFFGRGLSVLFPFGPGETAIAQRLTEAGAPFQGALRAVFEARVLEIAGIVTMFLVALVMSGWAGTLVPYLLSGLVVLVLTLTVRPMGTGAGGSSLWQALNGPRVVAVVRRLSREPSAFAGLVALSAAALVLEIAGLYLLKQSFSTREFLMLSDLPISGLVMAVCVASLARIVPFTPGGAGLYELSMVAVFLAYGADSTAGTTVAVLDGIFTNAVAVLMFLPTLGGGRRGTGVIEAWRTFFELSRRRLLGEPLPASLSFRPGP